MINSSLIRQMMAAAMLAAPLALSAQKTTPDTTRRSSPGDPTAKPPAADSSRQTASVPARPAGDSPASNTAPSATSSAIRSEDTAVHFQSDVATPAGLDAAHSARPEYPKDLAEAHIAGSVRARFVVDTAGRAEMGSLKILAVSVDVSRLPPVTGVIADTAANTRQITDASKRLFTQAVQNALPKMHFFAATVGDRHVRQLVEEQFNFTAR